MVIHASVCRCTVDEAEIIKGICRDDRVKMSGEDKMAFWKKNENTAKSCERIVLWEGETVCYEGRLDELTLDKKMILQKSMEFFDDPSPCYIHETAVRIRLIGEIEEKLQNGEDPLPLVNVYSVYTKADKIVVK